MCVEQDGPQGQPGDEFAGLRAEIAALRDTNRRLNRRANGMDSEWQNRAMKAELMLKWSRDHWFQEFKRFCAVCSELREIYLLVERARGRPVPVFHSVADLACGSKRLEPPGSVWAHVYIDRVRGGIRSERVVDAVSDVLSDRLPDTAPAGDAA